MSFDAMGDDRFRVLVEASPAALIATGRDGVVEFANAETERMFGYRKEDLIGKSVETLVPARLRKGHASFRQGFIASPSKRPMGAGRELKAVHRDGSEFPVEISLTPIETATGLVVLATVLDITRRRQTENALAERAAELERVNERLAQFAYVTSLDLQGPLKKITAFSELLENAIASSDRAEIAYASQVMRASALHARKLVDDLLTYSSTIYGEQQLEILDLREEVQFTLADLSESIAETNTEVSVEIPATTFLADRSQFSRLVQNIVTNAIKYRKPGRTAKIDIVAAPVEDDGMRLAIVDNGVGFEEEFAQTIFEPFARHGKVQYPGTGIELAICKSIADRHGWGISVRSHPGEGATFFFTIPTLFTIPAVEQE